ncbi:spermatogenesis-associated protein 45 [Halichoeres trimaculatus]|uniref:spermatogenesis-associated protein 45 n=1 Tax=Halichoeres trimaculatus TaxID=147232 RepID=UPI003D9E4582
MMQQLRQTNFNPAQRNIMSASERVSEQGAVLQLNLQRETWCQVELDPRQSWERAERRHYRSHLRTSPVLLSALTSGPQCKAVCRYRAPPVELVERRHYKESYKSHLV